MNKSSARTKFNVQVQLGLIDVNYCDYIITVVQNMSHQALTIPKGTAIAQLLIIYNQIPQFEMKWPLTHAERGGFGSTGNNFETITLP